MFRSRNLLAIGIAVVALILMTTWVSAQPLQQDTPTPEATTVSADTPVPTVSVSDTPLPTTSATDTPMPTVVATDTPAPTAAATAIAPTVSSPATPVGTPSTLPTTGASDDGTAAFSLLLMAAGAVILVSILGLAVSRRSR